MPPKRKTSTTARRATPKEIQKNKETQEQFQTFRPSTFYGIFEFVIGCQTLRHPKPTPESNPLPSRSETPPFDPPTLDIFETLTADSPSFERVNGMFTIWESYKVNGRLDDAQTNSTDLIVSNSEQRFTKLDKGAARWLSRKAEFNANGGGGDGESGNEDEEEHVEDSEVEETPNVLAAAPKPTMKVKTKYVLKRSRAQMEAIEEEDTVMGESHGMAEGGSYMEGAKEGTKVKPEHEVSSISDDNKGDDLEDSQVEKAGEIITFSDDEEDEGHDQPEAKKQRMM
ncbi:hypothetical protein B0J14DRAFT_649732 [Halenospora varia]|nr:hypothetical protein B0J14DRAFT_649732 [Halenospora varia]